MEKENQPPPLHTEQELTTSVTTSSSAQSVGPALSDQRPHLSIDIPAEAASVGGGGADMTPTPKRGGSTTTSSRRSSSGTPRPQRSSSFMLRQTVRSLLPAGSFKLFSASRIGRTSSLPLDDVKSSAYSSGAAVDAAGGAVDKSSSAASSAASQKAVHHMCRSQSLPMSMKKLNSKSFKRMDSLGGMYRVVPSTPRAPMSSCNDPDIVVTSDAASGHAEEDGEDIPEEEAVCRICLVELSEGSDTLKLECACKGELALAHKDCAVKWFSIKGTRDCEVCKHEVRNLPVTLLRLPSTTHHQQPAVAAAAYHRSRYDRYRVWHGTPILVIISILAYFCFLEQLLVAHDGIAALAISLPFSCILGLFSSLTTTSMVARRYVWIYAAVQFLFVVFFTHLFYRYLHLQAVISIILATFAGFGVGMTGNSIVVEILRWRLRRRAAPPATQTQQVRRDRRRPQQQQQSDDQPSSQPGQSSAVTPDVENPAVPQP